MTPAQRNAKKAMKLYHSGEAGSLGEAWDIVKGAKANPKRKRNSSKKRNPRKRRNMGCKPNSRKRNPIMRKNSYVSLGVRKVRSRYGVAGMIDGRMISTGGAFKTKRQAERAIYYTESALYDGTQGRKFYYDEGRRYGYSAVDKFSDAKKMRLQDTVMADLTRNGARELIDMLTKANQAGLASKKSNPRKRRNGYDSDETAIREVLLTVTNDGTFYEMVLKPFAKNMAIKQYKGRFSKELALKGYKTAADRADKFYSFNYGTRSRGARYWMDQKGYMLSADDRRKLAAELLDDSMEMIQGYVDDLKSGVKQRSLKNPAPKGKVTLKLTNAQLNALGRVVGVRQHPANRFPTRVIQAITTHSTIYLSKAQAKSIYKALDNIRMNSFLVEPRDRKSIDAVLNKLKKLSSMRNPRRRR
jgi:hypothetical protein